VGLGGVTDDGADSGGSGRHGGGSQPSRLGGGGVDVVVRGSDKSRSGSTGSSRVVERAKKSTKSTLNEVLAREALRVLLTSGTGGQAERLKLLSLLSTDTTLTTSGLALGEITSGVHLNIHASAEIHISVNTFLSERVLLRVHIKLSVSGSVNGKSIVELVRSIVLRRVKSILKRRGVQVVLDTIEHLSKLLGRSCGCQHTDDR
jgi:hypothetical protein